MIVFIDFDDVVFNSGKLSEELKGLFFKRGIEESLFEKYYYDENKTYNPQRQIDRIQEDSDKDFSNLKKEVSELIDNLGEYVFDDFKEFIEKVGRENIYILSFGDEEFQKLKIKNSGIDRDVEKTIIAKGKKSEQLKKFFSRNSNLEKEEKYFIDDKVHHIKDVKKNFPKIKTILIHRPEGRYHEKPNNFCDYEADNLKETNNIIIAS